jgi:hypothetical protein
MLTDPARDTCANGISSNMPAIFRTMPPHRRPTEYGRSQWKPGSGGLTPDDRTRGNKTSKSAKRAEPMSKHGRKQKLVVLPDLEDQLNRAADAAGCAIIDGWRTIESAPKDGRRVLLYWEDYICIARWRDDAQFGHGNDPRPGWQIFDCEEDVWYAWATEKPTHWMPVPPPPRTLREKNT